ncbi:MAG: GNAT family N-acetyltransferase [Candidatus Lokiarchaeota archaeon]
MQPKFFDQTKMDINWYYGYINKSHYIVDDYNRIIGCLNIIYLINYDKRILYYMDTVEIREEFRRQKLGTKLVNHVIMEIKNKYKKFYVFLLVAQCKQYKLKFFSKIGFVPIKFRKTKIGSHCIMSYPFDDNAEMNCKRMFEYFNWREEKKEFISSDCKFAYNPNPTSLYWCMKKKIYVTGLEKKNCPYYIKEQEILSEKKFLDLRELMN